MRTGSGNEAADFTTRTLMSTLDDVARAREAIERITVQIHAMCREHNVQVAKEAA